MEVMIGTDVGVEAGSFLDSFALIFINCAIAENAGAIRRVWSHADMRLAGRFKLAGMPHLGEQFLSKDLRRRSVAEAFARRRIQPIADLDQVGIGHR